MANQFEVDTDNVASYLEAHGGGLHQLLDRVLTARDAEWQARYESVNRGHLAALARIKELSGQNDKLLSEVAALNERACRIN